MLFQIEAIQQKHLLLDSNQSLLWWTGCSFEKTRLEKKTIHQLTGSCQEETIHLFAHRDWNFLLLIQNLVEISIIKCFRHWKMIYLEMKISILDKGLNLEKWLSHFPILIKKCKEFKKSYKLGLRKYKRIITEISTLSKRIKWRREIHIIWATIKLME